MAETPLFQSKHFSLHALGDGIHAAIATDGGSAISNAGLVDLGDQLLVFDTFLTPQAARGLLQRTIELFRRPPQLVINSHYHNDHIWGNQVFAPGAQIISSARTRHLIETAGAEEFQWYSSISAERLTSLLSQQNQTDGEGRQQLQTWIGYYEGLVEALPQLEITLPDITFESSLEIHDSRRSARLISFDDAHTGHDTILHLPEDGIVFMSDLLFVNCHPYLGDGDAHGLLDALAKISRLDATRFVAGHGPVGTPTDLKRQIDYVEHCLDAAHTLRDRGIAPGESPGDLEVPREYRGWLYPNFYKANIQFLCERLTLLDEGTRSQGSSPVREDHQ